MAFEADLDLKIGHFFLGAGAGGFAGVGDQFHRPLKFSAAVGIDRDLGGVADFHIHDVVLVHVYYRLHVVEIGHPHHFGAGKLIRRHHPLAQFAVQHRHHAVERRINRCLRKLITRLARAGLRALDAVQAGLIHRLRRVEARLRRQHLRL